MIIPMDHALPGFLGGLAIGAAATFLLAMLGRIAGVSGILGQALDPSCSDRDWRLAFLVGLPLGAVAFAALEGAPPVQMVARPPLLAAAGLLVGMGTRLGSGCTSGHGVCGLARRSRRSLVATLTFIAVGMATVAVQRWLFGIA